MCLPKHNVPRRHSAHQRSHISASHAFFPPECFAYGNLEVLQRGERHWRSSQNLELDAHALRGEYEAFGRERRFLQPCQRTALVCHTQQQELVLLVVLLLLVLLLLLLLPQLRVGQWRQSRSAAATDAAAEAAEQAAGHLSCMEGVHAAHEYGLEHSEHGAPTASTCVLSMQPKHLAASTAASPTFRLPPPGGRQCVCSFLPFGACMRTDAVLLRAWPQARGAHPRCCPPAPRSNIRRPLHGYNQACCTPLTNAAGRLQAGPGRAGCRQAPGMQVAGRPPAPSSLPHYFGLHNILHPRW
jgi:hypothetical protein